MSESLENWLAENSRVYFSLSRKAPNIKSLHETQQLFNITQNYYGLTTKVKQRNYHCKASLYNQLSEVKLGSEEKNTVSIWNLQM